MHILAEQHKLYWNKYFQVLNSENCVIMAEKIENLGTTKLKESSGLNT